MFKAFLNNGENVCIVLKLLYNGLLITAFFLVGNPMLHACPEVHGKCPQLDFNREIFHAVQAVNRDAHYDMVAAVSVGFGAGYVVPLLDDD